MSREEFGTMKKEKEKFVFSVNELGYFELGEMSPTDDLYVVGVTVVQASNFHLLERNPLDVKGYKWTVEYKSFGYQISSDSFELDDSDSKRGFIGDKATARIRANGAKFFEYLSETRLQFQVGRTKPGCKEQELMGQTFLELADLTKPNIMVAKYDLEIISTAPYPVSARFLDQKPELRVLIDLEVVPDFFKREFQISKSPAPVKERKGEFHLLKSPAPAKEQPEEKRSETASIPKSETHKKEIVADVVDSRARGDRIVGQEEEKVSARLSKRRTKVAVRPSSEKNENLVPNKTALEIEEWKMEQQSIFKAQMMEKEKAYLRILSKEWKKRDADRAKQIGEKARQLQLREAEIHEQAEKLAKKEEELKEQEAELIAARQSRSLEQNKALETEKLRYRRLQENFKIETEILQRRIEEASADKERMKGRLVILETRIQEKEEELSNLMASRNRWTDVEQLRKVDQLSVENQYLKDKVQDIETKCEEYRRSMRKLVEELEYMKKESKLNLQTENETLRMQMLANQHKNELAQDRKSVKDVADQIKSLKDFYETQSKTGIESTSTTRRIENRYKPCDYKNLNRVEAETIAMKVKKELNVERAKGKQLTAKEIEKEINNLCRERADLLRQGIYSHFDVIIKSIDTKITKLISQLPSSYVF